MTALWSAACAIDEPIAGAELASGATSRTGRRSSVGRDSAIVGHAPRFAGSSCTQAISAPAGSLPISSPSSPAGRGSRPSNRTRAEVGRRRPRRRLPPTGAGAGGERPPGAGGAGGGYPRTNPQPRPGGRLAGERGGVVPARRRGWAGGRVLLAPRGSACSLGRL